MSTPRINPNDPKWTAYVLGELDEGDRAAVERLLESSDEARTFVEDLKGASQALHGALASEVPPLLNSAQRAAVHTAAEARDAWPASGTRLPRLFAPWPVQWGLGLGAVAAVLIVAAVFRVPPESQGPQVREAGGIPSAPGATGQSVRIPNVDSAPSGTPAVPSVVPPAVRPAVPPAPAPVLTTELAPTGAALTGSVRDTSGSAIPGVTVTAVNVSSGMATSVTTDAAGRYTIADLEPRQAYRMSATLAGFRTASADLQLNPIGPIERDFTMSVGALAETITVTGEQPVVDIQTTRRSQAGGSFARGAGGGVAGGVVGGVAGGVVAGMPAPPAAVTAPPPPAVRSQEALTYVGRSGGNSIPPSPGTESYARVGENAFVRAIQEPLATFSIDVDTASYSNVRRFLNQNQLPPADAVRIEELVNYFSYDYARPSGSRPIGASMEITDAPWNPRHRLVRIGVKAREIEANRRPPSNLVFLIDVSGSMNTPQKLPLLKTGLKMLVDQLGENDVVSMVVYASATGLVLPPTSGEHKSVIAQAIDNLQAGGSTNGGAGIQLAYRQATANFIRGGVNRVILMTDGDFNVGITSQAELTSLIEDRAKSGVFLSVLGFGMGNLKDSTMEKLADMGNGHYAYIDTLNEARKVLVEEMSATLVTVAKDVKIQVDFNPGRVEAYRLIGYENRALRPEDFNNDLKDAGDMGAGHTVTALFEVVPRGVAVPGPSVDPSVFQPVPRTAPPAVSASGDILVLRVRYKLPEASDSTRMDVPLADRRIAFSDASPDFRFAASVAAFGMILKNSSYRGEATLGWVLDTATASHGRDRSGYRDEFASLVQKAIALRER
jgi:Ca-activated chloride channel homolog